jgi:polysaccharide export outer membrane protein
MRFLWLLTCASALALGGCGGNRLVGRPDLHIVAGTELPPPGREDLILGRRSYLIGPFDRVDIAVFGMAELTRQVQVDANGRFSLPLVGEIDAAGKSPQQLEDLIGERLRRYVRQPQVAVNADTVNQMITVDGSVEEPGQFPVTGRMTLMRAIARAKGLSEFGSARFVVVFRRVNDQDMAALYDLSAIRQGIYADPEVYANDVVYVGESQARRIFQNIITSSPLLTAPIIALLQHP